ncbi:inositol 1,4,5-trisphosphate receptor-interacting protein isoform X1 [Denticeps clupeoides]|nr:inositol 1,4,5-trisphosphate receptor-interacting protein isoform X1 [Denticeps clupeoides]
MQDTLLCVIVVIAGFLFPKEHFIPEQDHDLIADMQEREGWLREERKKLDEELVLVAWETIQMEQEVAQSRQILTQGSNAVSQKDEEDSQWKEWSQPDEKPEAMEKNPTSYNLQPGFQEALQQEVSEGITQTHHKWDQPAMSPEDRAHMAEKAQDQSQMDRSTALKKDFDDKSLLACHMKANKKESLTTKRKPGDYSTDSTYIWYLWNAYSIISLVRFLMRRARGDSQNERILDPNHNDTPKAAQISAEVCVPDSRTLSCFYRRFVYVPTHKIWRVCEFVEGFADDLLMAARNLSDSQVDMDIKEWVGVGSLYESWATGKTLTCDLWVPIGPQPPYSLEFQILDSQVSTDTSDTQGCAKVKMLKGASSCPCGQNNLDSDTLCLLHTGDATGITEAVNGPLCFKDTACLSRTSVVRWFRTRVAKAWAQISHKYEFELEFLQGNSPAFRIRFRSGKAIHFNLTPVLELKGTQAYLVSHLAPMREEKTSDLIWQISFASYETFVLKHYGKLLPEDSCHLQCLQLLSFLNRMQTGLTGSSTLTNYHLKTVLIHLLLDKRPSDWRPDCMHRRLHDMLRLLKKSIQDGWLSHAFIGNKLVPPEAGLPREFLQSLPVNLFHVLVQHRSEHLMTVKHFQEMLINNPVLIQEYLSSSSKMASSS